MYLSSRGKIFFQKRKLFIAFFIFLCIPAFSQSKPNIIFIFIDDMGYGDLSCFGNKEIKTPNIDRLAKEGIRFTNYYDNSPVCSPSRVAASRNKSAAF